MKLKFTPGLKVFESRTPKREEPLTPGQAEQVKALLASITPKRPAPERRIVQLLGGKFNAVVDAATLRNAAKSIGMNWDTMTMRQRLAFENSGSEPMTVARRREIALWA